MGGADLEPEDAVLFLAQRAKEDDGRAGVRRQPTTGGQSVFTGHHDIQDDHIHWMGGQHAIHLGNVAGGHDPIAPCSQAVGEEIPNDPIIIDDEEGGAAFRAVAVKVHITLVPKIPSSSFPPRRCGHALIVSRR